MTNAEQWLLFNAALFGLLNPRAGFVFILVATGIRLAGWGAVQ